MVKSAVMKRLFNILAFLYRHLRLWLLILLGIAMLAASSVPPGEQTQRVRAFTRQIEFDYTSWTLNALRVKLFESAIGHSNYLPFDERHQEVLDYLELVRQIQATEEEISIFYADPNVTDPEQATEPLRERLDALYERRGQIGPVAEAILQDQISYIAARAGLTLGGQPIPPVLYHSTPLPLALIVSPRQVIRQDEDISLIPNLTIDKCVALEAQVDGSLNVSSLVVEIGGVGTYPTMVQQTSYLDWLSEVVAHEWVHNYLTLRPLGMNYLTSPELRIMNETTASIAGKEIGRLVLEMFYPELVPPPPPPEPPEGTQTPVEPPAFNFNHEMHITRVTTDQLLAEGKIEEAEAYMEARRVFLWQHGYRIRKLNQAYFAFHGAYADEPGGAAGALEDPVGAAVRALRANSPSLSAFLNRISWMYKFDQLQQVVAQMSN
jgi:hypothetical protein